MQACESADGLRRKGRLFRAPFLLTLQGIPAAGWLILSSFFADRRGIL